MTYLIARGTEPRRVTSRILERELTQKWMRATLRRRGPQVEENQQERTDHGCPKERNDSAPSPLHAARCLAGRPRFPGWDDRLACCL